MSASLGGIDRSTVAVIEPGTIVGGSRPTIAYFGAADGMLHAVCASDGTTACPTGSIGKQLWAFMPRVELPLVQYNEQRIDGSVHVADVYGDFTPTHTGTRTWKTVLTFQTGYSNPAHGGVPASYAIDVTDPASPSLLWEYTTPTSPGVTDYGTGLVAAVGPTVVNGQLSNLAVLETNNGGSGTAGVVATAIQIETGTKLWQFSYTYPTAAAVPAAALPGGAVGVDLAGAGNTTDYVMGDLYGDLWRLNAQTGASQNGTNTPLFAFSYNASTDKHPIGAVPAIYSDGNTQYVAVAAGGYADQTDGATSWSFGTHYLVSVKIKATSTPVLDTQAASNGASGDLRLKIAIASGSKAYSQPTIVGNQMFVISDIADVNASSYGANQTGTGRDLTINGINGAATSNSYDTTTSTIYGGASSLVAGHDASGTLVLIGSSSDKQSQVGNTAYSAAGTGVATTTSALGAGSSVDTSAVTKLTRNLWIRSM
jgi:type IV pilus assembly protein PilY1